MDELPSRKPNRLRGFAYDSDGKYFLTLCAREKQKLFGEIVRTGAMQAPAVVLSPIGAAVEKYIRSADRAAGITVEKYVIMPNHVHVLVAVCGSTAAHRPSAAAIPQMVAALKRMTNREIGQNVFQRSFHDHIIRGDADYRMIWQYIEHNPAKWDQDCFFVP